MKRINQPEKGQLLIFPMTECTVSAGFKNTKYKKDYGYVHYGVDFDDRWGKDFDVIASGEGTVLATEKNSNSIGGVVVIKYTNVYDPSKSMYRDIVARYLHLYSIKVKKGDKVAAYQVIGTISGGHKWWNHIHMEIDTDVKHPFHTPQVAEASSKLLIRGGATDSTMLDPMHLLVIGHKQTCVVHSLAVYANKATDSPRFEEIYTAPAEPVKKEDTTSKGKIVLKQSIKETEPKPPPAKAEVTSQKLVLPLAEAKITCGYKNKSYYNEFHMNHYGADFVSNNANHDLYGIGYGKVIKAGWDGTGVSVNGPSSGCGFVLIVQYNNVYIRKTGKTQNLICTYMHMAELPAVKAGDEVTPETFLGYYGDTGYYVTGAHLHIQFDTDDKYPEYCTGIGSGHRILKHGTTDSTLDPCDVLYIGKKQLLYLGKYENQYDKTKVLSIPRI